MTDIYSRAQSAADYIRTSTDVVPTIGIILGSGLGNFATQVDAATRIPYAEIPHFPRSTVQGHSGHLVLGTIAGIPVAVMQGRVHAYEGYPISEVTFPTRVLGLIGCKTLIVTNAAGGINTGYRQGSLIALTDHINLTGTNAALGPNEPRFSVVHGAGQRFFDMSAAYSPRLRAFAVAEAARQGFQLAKASTSPSSAPASKPRRRSAPSAPSAPTSSACPPSTRPSSPATWASRSSASRSSPTWPQAS